MRDFYEMYMSESACQTCHGARLKKESLSVKIGNLNIKQHLFLLKYIAFFVFLLYNQLIKKSIIYIAQK